MLYNIHYNNTFKEYDLANYYTSEEVTKKSFLFVSYNHENKELVTEVIDFLLDSGVRLWYDADLGIGDEWNEFAEKLIKHPNCKGIIFFNSVESFKSQPIYQERCFALEKVAAYKKEGRHFPIFPVNIGKPSTLRLIKSIFDSLPDSEKEIDRVFPLEYLKNISEIFKSNTIYCYADPDDKEGYMQRLNDAIAKTEPSVIDKSAVAMKELRSSTPASNPDIRLGICKDKLTSALPDYLLTANKIVEYKGAQYIVENGKAYSVKPIVWRPLYCHNDTFVLLSEEIVDVRNGGKDLSEWLETKFLTSCFTDEERAKISKIRLLTPTDMTKTESETAFVFPPSEANSESNWWIDAMGTGVLQKIIKKNGTVYNSGYNYRIKKCGVRPVITVHKDIISDLA